MCVGISRLERWERAKQLGKDPPDHIRELIEQHPSDSTYTEGSVSLSSSHTPYELTQYIILSSILVYGAELEV